MLSVKQGDIKYHGKICVWFYHGTRLCGSSLRSVVADLLDCDIVVSRLEITFGLIALEKIWTLLYTSPKKLNKTFVGSFFLILFIFILCIQKVKCFCMCKRIYRFFPSDVFSVCSLWIMLSLESGDLTKYLPYDQVFQYLYINCTEELRIQEYWLTDILSNYMGKQKKERNNKLKRKNR